MKKILLYLIVSLSLLNNVQANCDSCRMYCADMHRFDENGRAGCSHCNSCVEDLCYRCSWCGGRDTITDVNTSYRVATLGYNGYGEACFATNVAGGVVCSNDSNTQQERCENDQIC